MSNSIIVMGIGDDGRQGLPSAYIERIEASELLVGGERQLQFFDSYAGEKLTIGAGLALSALAERLAAEERTVVVLASGDPLFYGIGGYLAGKLPGRVEVYPALSSLQLAFARIGDSWHDAAIVSLHGRPIQGLAQRIDGRRKVALLTDERNHPGEIARYLLEFGMTEYELFVGEHLGGDQERTGWYSLNDAAALADDYFAPLNVVVLRVRAGRGAAGAAGGAVQTDSTTAGAAIASGIATDSVGTATSASTAAAKAGRTTAWPLGIDDAEFAQRKPDKGLITKREVRVLSLAALGLKPDSIVWDIGTCTGSVAIEAARLCRDGAVYAIEKNEADLANAIANSRKFRTDITFVHGKAPEGLEAFPDPDAVFIGGSGGELRELLALCCSRLRPGGTIVLNAATIENLAASTKAFAEEGFVTDITLAQLSRSKPILDMTRFEGLNPVYIIAARRRESDAGEREKELDAGSGRKSGGIGNDSSASSGASSTGSASNDDSRSRKEANE
ncbi:precorrin-6y C5,15-methyltransferase (decarboxylating) subunit CbiE [Paenibacillus sp. YYML68]|uniref:precorrin-6y C5,15-methyltransferase (decarboxylating) subunit CbiE n=1 Tax=Paenibacillus sp. YYML68 TaxID=2909250 RepID=UPI0024936BD3|nr:precorrin-6y C5,15-methyltransferase (decarboxylating) subunit CbiE [Paenibacillus sp. YYML68]